MSTIPKSTVWIAAAMSALGACVVVALLSVSSTTTAKTENTSRKSPQERAVATNAVKQASAITYSKHVDAWRSHMQSLRTPQRLRGFVEELIGIEQKLKQGLGLVTGESDQQRVLALFRRRVLDERQLAAELKTTVDTFDEYLFEQDRKFYEPAGLSREQWTQRVHGDWRLTIYWSRLLQPVVDRAVIEARQDAARFIVGNVVADFVGDGIKKYARQAGWDKTKEGSVGDFLSGFIIDVGAGVVIDQATDATDGIVSRLGSEMARAEHEVLDGKYGLFAELRRLQEAHEKARNSLLTTAKGR